VNPQDTSAETKPDLQLEIAHVLLIDVVGYSKLLVDEQIEFLKELNQIVRSTECFRAAETAGKLIRVPTGDGMALLFFRSPEEPVRCGLEISRTLKDHPRIQVRMGVHSGPVNQVTDVNDRTNIAGAGINIAQRVMDCGDAGHILLSKHLADDLTEYRHWRPHLHDLGECEVKYGLRLHLVNLYKDDLGNPHLPEKLKRGKRWKEAAVPLRRISAPRLPKSVLLIAVLGSAVALAVSFSTFCHRAPPTQNLLQPAAALVEKGIAVLPFQNLSDEKENAYFADGVQDEILTDLSKVADLKVISRTSVMQYKNAATRNLREIAQQLGVAHVLEGSVQRAGNRVRVSAQLIDARTDTHLWAERYDRPLDDVFAIQSEVAQAIADQLNTKLSPEEKAAIKQRPTADLVAYDLYVRANAVREAFSFNATRTQENLLQAVHLLEQAVARDPTFFLAYCRLAEAHDLIYFVGTDHTPARLALANSAIQTALRLRPNSGEAHLALAEHLYRGYRDHQHALAELTLARRALPNEPLIFELTGFITRRQGRWEESTTDLKRALELDPRNLFFLQQLSFTYEFQRRYRDLAAVLDRALKLVPSDPDTRVARALIDLAERADPRSGHATIEAVVAEDPAAARTIAERWFYIAMCERDNLGVSRALAVVLPEGITTGNIWSPRAYLEALAARARGDATVARTAFTAARAEVEKTMRGQPDYAQGLTVLGLIDAGLGRKDDAIREGRRAVELVPVSKDVIDGTDLILNLAVIYAWTGEKDLALKQLAGAAGLPSPLSYGWLRLHPDWDPLRGDPRFEKIVASLAPKEAAK
jgi:TolB-like protein/class 3 adenylate cyclase/Tfp pilus assembly protein PilF